MKTPSLGPAGLVILRADDVAENLRQRLRDAPHWGPLVETGPGSRVGNLLLPFAEQLGEVYGLLQAVYDSQVADAAEGVPLANVCALTLCRREPATFSRVLETLTGDEGTPIPAGHQIRVPGGPIFALDVATEIPAAGHIDAWYTAVESGRQFAEVGGITEIVDAITGLDSVTNAAAVDETTTGGHPIESDESLRLRRERSLARAGSSTDGATRARLEAYDWITAAVVVSNRTDATVGDLTPHSLAIYLWPAGLDVHDVAAAIYGEFGVPGGIRLVGTEVMQVQDDQGQLTEVRWSYLTELAVYAQAVVEVDTEGAAYPADGDDQVSAAIVGYGAALAAGRDVLPDHGRAWVLKGWIDLDGVAHPGVPGIRVLTIRLSVGAPPEETDTDPIVVGVTQIARIDAAHVTVLS